MEREVRPLLAAGLICTLLGAISSGAFYFTGRPAHAFSGIALFSAASVMFYTAWQETRRPEALLAHGLEAPALGVEARGDRSANDGAESDHATLLELGDLGQHQLG